MPISSGAGGRGRLGGRDTSRPSASISSARSTPNLAQPVGQSGQSRTGRRMIDAPPRVETRRQLGSQTLYGSRPPWATDEDAPSLKKEQQTPTTPQQPQPPFYPAGGELLHGEAARMRRLKAARELYKSPHSRRKHNTGSVDDLLRDCAVSDHSHSPSPLRRAPSAASSTNDLQAQRERSTSRPGHSTCSTGVGTSDGPIGGSPTRRRRRNDNSIESDDSLEDGDDRKMRAGAASSGTRHSRPRQSRISRGTSPPPPQKPLYVDTGCDASDWGARKSPTRQNFARTKMPPSLKPAADRKYVPPAPVRHPSPSIKRHDCLPSENPPFRARPMPDFRRVSPSPGRNRSRSQSPVRPAAVAQTSSATTSGYRSGGGSSPPRRRDQQPGRRRSMDEDSLTEASSTGPGDRSVTTEIVQPRRAPDDRRSAAADAVDSGFRSLEQEPAIQQRGGGSGRSSLLLVPEKVFKDRSVTDIDLDEIFGTSGQPPQQQQWRQQAAPSQFYSQPTEVGENNGEVNERIQYWLKRNIYFHACEPAPDSQPQPQQPQQPRSKYASSPPSSETLRSMSEHRPQQPQMEIIVQRTDVHQLPPAKSGDAPRHVSTVEYPVRKFQQLPYGYLSPSSSEDDGSSGEEDAGGRPSAPGAEILRQAVVYTRSSGADSGFWFSDENGGAPRSLGTAYNGVPAQPGQQQRPGSAASSSGGSSRGGGRVRALASRFNQQQPALSNGEYLSSYQQLVTPGRPQPQRNGPAAGGSRQSGAPMVSSQLRRATPGQPPAPASAAADSKTFYFGDSALVSKREQREHWASDYFNRPKIEIIDRSSDVQPDEDCAASISASGLGSDFPSPPELTQVFGFPSYA
uniref:Protein kinase domain-containing protein n=1 Tax=Macrostomum lignano TaxID=282301 RepID=A0A1I8HK43_9PLAT